MSKDYFSTKKKYVAYLNKSFYLLHLNYISLVKFCIKIHLPLPPALKCVFT